MFFTRKKMRGKQPEDLYPASNAPAYRQLSDRVINIAKLPKTKPFHPRARGTDNCLPSTKPSFLGPPRVTSFNNPQPARAAEEWKLIAFVLSCRLASSHHPSTGTLISITLKACDRGSACGFQRQAACNQCIPPAGTPQLAPLTTCHICARDEEGRLCILHLTLSVYIRRKTMISFISCLVSHIPRFGVTMTLPPCNQRCTGDKGTAAWQPTRLLLRTWLPSPAAASFVLQTAFQVLSTFHLPHA